MRMPRLGVFLVGCCLLLGCKRQAALPPNSFQVQVQNVASNKLFRTWFVTVRACEPAALVINVDDETREITLANVQNRELGEAQFALGWHWIATNNQPNFNFIEVSISPPMPSASLGCFPVPMATEMASFFSVTAKPGIYSLDNPLTIADVGGVPVTLTVKRRGQR